jgi:hypothetical protein
VPRSIADGAIAAGRLLLAGAWLGFGYAALTAVLHPDSLSRHVARAVPLRIDTFGAACFAVSFVTQCTLGCLAARRPRA